MPKAPLTAAVLAVVLIACPARAEVDWSPELQPPQNEFRGRSEAIVITLPASLDPALYDRLSVELDDLDVTAFVTAESGRLVFTPPESLSTGQHSLRLIERGDDGSILERGAWTLEIRQSALLRDLSVNADLSGEVDARVADGGLDTPSQHVTGQSGGNVETKAGDEQWHVSAKGNYLYNSQAELGPNGQRFDLGEYRLDGDYEGDSVFAGLTFGDHDTGIKNLLMSDFYRRGASVRIGTADKRLTATGFVQSTDALIGTRKPTGINDPQDRIEGAAVSVRPIAALQDNVELTGMAYTGEGSDGGTGIGTEQVDNAGSGWSVGANTLWFDEALRVDGEYDQSRFDFDGKDQGLGAESADAYSVLASVEPLRGTTLDGSALNWTFGVQRQQVDTFFQSLANPSLQPDRETTSFFTDFYWDEFAAQFRIDHQLSNVDNRDFLPTDRTINAFFNGTYTPYIEPREDGSLPWYGQPFFGISAAFYDIDRIKRSTDFPSDNADNTTRSVTFSTGSNYQTWSWNLSHTIYSFQDKTGQSSDMVNNTTALSAYLLVDNWLTLSPSAQWDMSDDLDTHAHVKTLNLGLNTDVTVIPDTLTASLSYTMNLQSGSGDTPDTHSLSGEVVWTLRQAEANKLGVALAFTGFVQDTHDDFDNPNNDLQYQAFTALRLSLPVAY